MARKRIIKGIVVINLLILVAISMLVAKELPKFEQPVLISTAGQSVDMYTVKAICNKANIKSEVIPLAKPKDLEGIKTLIMVPAHSNKGLGSAGIDVEGEMRRVKTLLKGAKELNIPVMLVHVGGQIRRSADSDPFIYEVLSYPPKLALVFKDGNKDNMFTKKCSSSNIPLVIVDKVFDLTDIMKQIFNVK